MSESYSVSWDCCKGLVNSANHLVYINLFGFRFRLNDREGDSIELRLNLEFALLPASGNRNNSNGLLYNQGNNGNYWSTTTVGTNAYNLNFNSSNINPANSNNRGNGFALRCIKNLQGVPLWTIFRRNELK